MAGVGMYSTRASTPNGAARRCSHGSLVCPRRLWCASFVNAFLSGVCHSPWRFCMLPSWLPTSQRPRVWAPLIAWFVACCGCPIWMLCCSGLFFEHILLGFSLVLVIKVLVARVWVLLVRFGAWCCGYWFFLF